MNLSRFKDISFQFTLIDTPDDPSFDAKKATTLLFQPSTKQRFISLEFDYPEAETEKNIIIKESGVDEDTAKKLVSIAGDIRNLSDTDIQEAVSTRLLVYSAKLMVKGFDAYEACIHTIVQSLSDEDEVIEVLEKLVGLHFMHKA